MSDYDRSIHSNPDAAAWAAYFVKTWREIRADEPPDEGWMLGWFANAMMAMHDAGPRDAEIARLRAQLAASAARVEELESKAKEYACLRTGHVATSAKHRVEELERVAEAARMVVDRWRWTTNVNQAILDLGAALSAAEHKEKP